MKDLQTVLEALVNMVDSTTGVDQVSAVNEAREAIAIVKQMMQAEPVDDTKILARGRFHAFKGEDGEPDDWEWFEAGTECEGGCVDAVIVRADSIQAAQPVREPSPGACKTCGNEYLASRTDVYKDKRPFIYCDCCGAMADSKTWYLTHGIGDKA